MDPDKMAARQQPSSTEQGHAGVDLDIEKDVTGAAAAAAGDLAQTSGVIHAHSDDLIATITPPPSESEMVTSETQSGNDSANSDSAGSSYVTIDLESNHEEAFDLSKGANKGAGGEEPDTKMLPPRGGGVPFRKDVPPQVESVGEFSVLNSDVSVLSELEFTGEDDRPLNMTRRPSQVAMGGKSQGTDSESMEETDDRMEVEADPVNKQPASKAPKTSATASKSAAKRRGGSKRRASASRSKEAQGGHGKEETKTPRPPGAADGRPKLESGTGSLKHEGPFPNAPQTSANLEAMAEWMPVDVDGAEGAAGIEGGDQEMPQQRASVEEASATVEGSNRQPAPAATGQDACGPGFATDFRRVQGASPSLTRGHFRGPAAYHYSRGPANGISSRLHRTFPERHMYLPAYGPYHQYGPGPAPERFQRTGTFPGSVDLSQTQGSHQQPAHGPAPQSFLRSETFTGSGNLQQPQGSFQYPQGPAPELLLRPETRFSGLDDLLHSLHRSDRDVAASHLLGPGVAPTGPGNLQQPQDPFQHAQGPAPERFQRPGTNPGPGNLQQSQGSFQHAQGPAPELLLRPETRYSGLDDLIQRLHESDRDVAALRLLGPGVDPTHRQHEGLNLQVRGRTSEASATPPVLREDISVHIRDNNSHISIFESRVNNDGPSVAAPSGAQGLDFGKILENVLGPTAVNFPSTATGNIAGLAPENVEGQLPRNVAGMPPGYAHGTPQGMHHAQGGFNASSTGNVGGEIPRNARAAAANASTIQTGNDRRGAQADNAMASGNVPQAGQGNFNASAPGNIRAHPSSARGDGTDSDELPTTEASGTGASGTGTPRERTIPILVEGTSRGTPGNLVPPSMTRVDLQDFSTSASGNLSGGLAGSARPPVQGIVEGASGISVPPIVPEAERAIPEDLSTSASGNRRGGTTGNARPPAQVTADGASGIRGPPSTSGAGDANQRNAPGPVQGTLRIFQRSYRYPFSMPSGPTAGGGFDSWIPPFPDLFPVGAAGNAFEPPQGNSPGAPANAFRGPPPSSSGAVRAAQSALNAPGNTRRASGVSRGRFILPQGSVPDRAARATPCNCPPAPPGALERQHTPQCQVDSMLDAAGVGDMSALIRLLSTGLNPNAVRELDGVFPLYVACERGQLGSVCVLLGFGADPNQRGPNQRTPLHMAALHGHAAMVTRLMDSGGNVFAEDSSRDTPLHLAINSCRWEVVSAVLRRNPTSLPSPDWTEKMAFSIVEVGGPIGREVLSGFLQAGLPPDVENPQQETLLAVAARLQRWEEVRLLLQWRADPRRCRVPRECALAHAARHGRADIVRLLLQRGAAEDADQALWALGFAATAEVVQAFVEIVPQVVRGPAGVNGLVVAAHNGKLESVKALLDAGVDINGIGIHERTALQGAAIFGHVAILNELLRRGANVNETSIYDDTALHLAAHRDQEECVRALLAAGANPTLRNNLGMLPSDYAHNDSVRQMLMNEAAQGDE